MFDPRTFAYLPLHDAPQVAWAKAAARLANVGFVHTTLVHSIPLSDLSFPPDDTILGHIVSQDFHEFCRAGERAGKDYNNAMQSHLKGAKGEPHLVKPKHELETNSRTLIPDHLEAFATATDLGLIAGYSAPLIERRNATLGMIMTWSNKPQELQAVLSERMALLHQSALYFNEGLQVRLLHDRKALTLSQREGDCLAWLSAGLPSKVIADRLKLAETTVNEYLTSATKKLGATNRTQAAARAMLLGHFQI